MSERVAVYLDFDNVVISRYDNLHGDNAWRKDDARRHKPNRGSDDPVDVKLAEAEVDLGAIIDYAASFGTVAFTKAYADWSVAANAAYQRSLVERAVDLVQAVGQQSADLKDDAAVAAVHLDGRGTSRQTLRHDDGEAGCPRRGHPRGDSPDPHHRQDVGRKAFTRQRDATTRRCGGRIHRIQATHVARVLQCRRN